MIFHLVNILSIAAIFIVFTLWIREKTRNIENRTVFYTYASPQIVILGGSYYFKYSTFETLFMIAAVTIGSGLFFSFLEEPSLR